MMKTAPAVLLVDEDATFAQVAAGRLQALGYQVLCATSAEDAIQTARDRHPSFILLDRGLPGDGAASRKLLAAVKADSIASRIPVLMTTLQRQMARAKDGQGSGLPSKRVRVDFRQAVAWTADIRRPA
jgi:CheY-like chemotaxis protein